MKRILTIAALMAAFCFSASAQEFRFHEDGSFKIVQFSDLHTNPGHAAMPTTFRNLDYVIRNEKPDLVVFSGDVVVGKPAEQALRMVLDAMENYNTPYVIVQGNHDHEMGMPMEDYCSMTLAAPHCINKANAAGLIDDMVFEIRSASSDSTKALVYCLDSQTYSKVPGVKGYGWFSASQVNWYRRTSAEYAAGNGGTPLPAMAFYHICLPEFGPAFNARVLSGKRLENECNGKVNAGMLAAMIECGGMLANFVGHDHDNDYITEYCGIDLGYARTAAWRSTYNNIGSPGARVIVLKEGEYDYSTYLRLLDGRVISPYSKSKGSLARLEAIDPTGWMGGIPDATMLCKVSIPGTHDSGAMLGSKGIVTQDVSIARQLELGIRAFDIRLKAIDGGKLGVFHASQFMNCNWEDDVLPTFKAFLAAHPTEALVVSVKCEHNVNVPEYLKRLAKSLKKDSACYVNDFRADITMGECRGKMLLLHRTEGLRAYPGVLCTGWKDNQKMVMIDMTSAEGIGARACVEDHYSLENPSGQYKYRLAMENILRCNAEASDSQKWYLTYASAAAGKNYTPAIYASIVNPGAGDELQCINKPCGIIFMDFAGAADTFIARLINSNFGKN